MNLFSDALDFVADMREQVAGETITYQRINATTSLTATKGKTTHEVDDESGVRTQTDSHDWLLRATDLVIDDERVLPEVGDRIYWEDPNGDTHEYEIASFGNPAIHYRPSDPQNITLRIHCQHLGTT